MKSILQKLNLLVFLVLSLQVQAQDNVGQQSYELVKNTVLDGITLNSMIKPIAVVPPENGSVYFSYAASGVYEVHFTPDFDFTGEDYFVAEYYVNNGIPTPKYVHFTLQIKNSVLIPQADYTNTDINTVVDILPLANDYGSHGPLSIVGVSYTTAGSVELVGSDTLRYTPETDFVGDAYLNYIVSDSLGYTTSGTIKVGVHDINNISDYELIEIATTNKNPATILLPLSGFSVDPQNSPLHGSVSFVGTDVLEYTSNFGNATRDTFSLIHSGNYVRDIIVETIHIPQPNGFVIDDYFITTVGEPITFDVQANDVKKNFPIISYTNTAELVQDSTDQSVFTYTPATGFQGEKIFSYTVTNGAYNETGYITVLVSNFNPESVTVYNLSTPKNTPLVINYDIPISNFSFIENASPIDGSLHIYPGVDTIAIGCDNVSGFNLVTYTPDADFVGSDQFEILYCVDNNSCELVKVHVDVQNIGLDSICLCVADCVWAGDADNDGKVSVADLLPIAYHQGISGSVRDEAAGGQSWFGQHAQDWNINQVYVNKDLKHADSNGDGIIMGDDVQEITSYYNRFHDLVAPDNLVIKDYPFVPQTDQDTVYAGELLTIDLLIGSDEYPAVNLHGIAYGLTFPADLIDSASVVVDYLNNGWFGANSPGMEMAVQPSAGRIEASFSRTSGVPVSGFGIVATVSFIVEDDIQGIFIDDEVIPMEFYLEPMKVNGIGGSSFSLPAVKKTIYLDLRGKKEFNPVADINLYPNPANSEIFIHANSGVDITSVEVYSMSGQLLKSNTINFSTARIDVTALQPGIYLARVETSEGNAVRKFVVE